MVKSEIIWSKALKISKKAIDCGAVIPLHTIKYHSDKNLCDYQLRFLKSVFPNSITEYGPKSNPFIPWDRRLEIEGINDQHILILNKYPVQLGHMLLISNSWKPQNGWLNIIDFEAIITVDNDTTGLWFFNSDKQAGASQPHRHFQLLRRDNYEQACPRNQWFISLLNNKLDSSSILARSIIVKPRTKSKSNAIDLFNCYKSMCLEMDIGVIGVDNKPLHPYNLLITNDWIALIRRSTHKSFGFKINALGFAGYFLATKNSNTDILIKSGPDEILNQVVNTL